jgi:DNA-directed RNA polymerase specialized sigma24 family protein
MPDRWLLEAMAHGDRGAARELRRRHAKSLYALAYGVLWDSAVADVVVAQAFDQASRTAREFGGEAGTVFGWLAGITRTRARTAAAVTPF